MWKLELLLLQKTKNKDSSLDYGVVIWPGYKNKSSNRIFFILFASGKNSMGRKLAIDKDPNPGSKCF